MGGRGRRGPQPEHAPLGDAGRTGYKRTEARHGPEPGNGKGEHALGERYDVVVLGGGVVGASIAYHLKKLGAGKVALFERGELCSGGTARSCAIIRTHYSIHTNTELAVKSLEVFRRFPDALQDREAECGFVNSGYLILAPEGEIAERLRRNLAMQATHGAATTVVAKEEARERHPLLDLEDVAAIGYEPESGYADPYLTTMSYIRAAQRLGVEVKAHCPATSLALRGARVVGVTTLHGWIGAGLVVAALGPWSGAIARWAELELPLKVSRHIVLTLRAAAPYERTLPIVKDLVTANKMYFRPSTGGVVLVGTGDHGDPLDDPESMDDTVGLDFVAHQGGQIACRMPSFADAELAATWTGPYDITPDWNPILGPVPGVEGLHVAYGFSGHGFKLAPMVGKVVAQAALGLTPEVDVTPYRLTRFAEGKLLTGA
ncbi:MAG: NAD(P)/FAD-dependent oxidoreductase, partial [Alphaproteobacteria bacterium]